MGRRRDVPMLLILFCIFACCDASIGAGRDLSLENALLIFNSIHSSMRQWGSSLNHNGMSFYPARVPNGTQLYHGNGNKSAVIGMDWLAFEPEHALVFASIRGPRNRARPASSNIGIEQSPLIEEPEDPISQPSAGWLHTYSTKRDLNLLYIDGMSAGKTTNGTLDSQDYIIRNSTAPVFFFDDYTRARNMCTMAQEVWQGRMDGFLRMEMGFEIILCDFERNLDEILITRKKSTVSNNPLGRPIDDQFSYWRAITDRYNGIGGHRVAINYDDFFTTYTYDLNLFNGNLMPRLNHLPAQDLAILRSGLDDFILKDPNPFTATSVDWQAVADLIVTRYAQRLQYLTLGDVLDTHDQLKGELRRALVPFIDYDHRDPKLEIERCTSHFLPANVPITLAARVITHVSHYLCSELVESLQSLLSPDHQQSNSAVQDRLGQLIQNLNWTVWKECGSCKSNEICFTPIWPHGSFVDWLKPSCLNATEIPTRNGYWGMRGGPGRRPNATWEAIVGV